MTHIAYLFPGQGSQCVGMGRALVEAYAVARDTFAEADAILGFSLSALCFAGPAETLTETRNTQPALLTTSIAALRALQTARPDLPPPCCVAGHSLGEYTALVATGALAFADAVGLTRVRGELMAEAGAAHPGGMAAILRLEDDQVAELCTQAAAESGDVVQPANFNSPGQVVISGGPAGIAAAVALAKAAGGRAIPLAVSIAAHSALMEPATQAFARHVAATPCTAPTFPVIGNVQAAPLTTPEEIRQELMAQLITPVRWTASVAYMMQAGATRFIEIGPGSVLSRLVKRINRNAKTATVGTPEEIEAFTNTE